MNRQVCKYSIIRFQPYPETEEFANIGIVLYATASKRLEFRLLDGKQHARITHFFDDLCKDTFVRTSKIIRAELERIQCYLEITSGLDLYSELIRQRQDIIRFSENRVLFSNDPAATIDNLFEHYVHRSFLHEPTYEEKLKKQVRELLNRFGIGDQYKEDTLGKPEQYEVRFPFVCKTNKHTVIKPIHFKHDKPSQLIDHGITWLGKVRQLQQHGFIAPNEILFAYDAPEDSQTHLAAAFQGIKQQIEREGIVMANIACQHEIIKFASVAAH